MAHPRQARDHPRHTPTSLRWTVGMGASRPTGTPAPRPRAPPLRPRCSRWRCPTRRRCAHRMPEPGTRRPVLLLANPAAGDKPGGTNADLVLTPAQLLERLRAGGLTVELHELAEEDDAAALARTAASEGRDVVVAGGDGTVGPVASGLVDSDATLGIIPLGTFNNIARGARIPIEPDEAVAVVVRGRAAAVDAGSAWHLPAAEAAANPPADAATFFEAVGIGLDAAGFGVAQVGERLGLVAAAKAAWRVFRRRKPPLWLEVDGKRYRTASPAVTICN